VRALDSLSMSYTGLRGVNNGKEFEGVHTCVTVFKIP